MNIIFLTVSHIEDIQSRGIYTDLMRKFRDEGHHVYIVTPYERRYGLPTSIKENSGVQILGINTFNIQKTNVIEKGFGTILLEYQFNNAIKKYFKNISFDLILYTTPPITFTKVIKSLKRRNQKATSYLLLKDIFPQNAIDLRMFSKQSPFYYFFRHKEKELYRLSDYIGCMSPANVEYLLRHNPFIPSERVEVAPNSIELIENRVCLDKERIRKKYDLPINIPIFIYGGNLGKPQGIDYLIQCLKANSKRRDCHFLIVGNGMEYNKIKSWFDDNKPKNISLFSRLPKKDYDLLVQSCDVGLIFLDYRFRIPNYPCRLLSYLECKMPIIAATDPNTDIGTIAQNNGYGYWCESNRVDDFTSCVNKFVSTPESVKKMGERGYEFLLKNYLIENTYQKIMLHINK